VEEFGASGRREGFEPLAEGGLHLVKGQDSSLLDSLPMRRP
jgi:hypothetical protein